MLGKIFLKNLELDAIIGVYEIEKEKTQKLILNIELECDFEKTISDNIEDALNYAELEKQIIKFVENSKFNLLEKLAIELGGYIKNNFPCPKITIEIQKPEALGMISEPGIVLSL